MAEPNNEPNNEPSNEPSNEPQNQPNSEPQNTPDGAGGEPPASVPAWAKQLAGDLQGNEKLTSFESISDLGKAFVELSEKHQKAVELPGEDADEGDWEAFYEKIGRPEDPKDYQPQLPEDAPKDFKLDEDRLNSYREMFHKLGLPKSAGEKLLTHAINEELAAAKGFEQAREKASKELADTWGDNYKDNLLVAKKAAVAFGGEELANLLDQPVAGGGKLGDNPTLIKALYNIGSKMSDDDIVQGSAGGGKDREFGQLEYQEK